MQRSKIALLTYATLWLAHGALPLLQKNSTHCRRLNVIKSYRLAVKSSTHGIVPINNSFADVKSVCKRYIRGSDQTLAYINLHNDNTVSVFVSTEVYVQSVLHSESAQPLQL